MPTETLRPDIDITAQWVANGGVNFEVASDADDGTWNEGDTVGQTDLFGTANLSVSGVTINSVAFFCRHGGSTSDPDDRIQLRWKVGVDEARSTINVLSSITETSIGIENPNGGDWTESAVNSVQIGYILTSIDVGTSSMKVYDIWLVVNYTTATGHVMRSSLGISGLGGEGQMAFDPLR